MFKKIDKFFSDFFHPWTFQGKLEAQQEFLLELKSRNMNIDDALVILGKLIKEESCNIIA